MFIKLISGIAAFIALSVVPTRSNDIAGAIKSIEQGLSSLQNAFSVSCHCNDYIGCFKDTPKRTLGGRRLTDYSLTKEKCFARCRDRKFRYAGLQHGAECFCGNSLNATKRPETECYLSCGGNKEQIYGGVWRNSVYHLK